MQDLNDMLFFAEVVDRGGFAAAGRALDVPKSKLSRRVAELEHRLGVRLLQRTTRKLSLTEAGEVYHRHCVTMREAAEAANEAVEVVRSEPRGTVRVSCPVTLAQSSIGRLIPAFLQRHAHVRIDMQVSNRVVDLIEEGIDVALRVRPTVDDSGSLVVKPLGEAPGQLVASRELLLRLGRPASVDDLAELPSVAMSAASDGRASFVLVGPDGQQREVAHRPVYVADDLATLKHAIVQGTGLGMLPSDMCEAELAAGQLEEVLAGWAPPAAVFHAVFPSRRGMVPAVRRFLDFLAEHASCEAVRARIDSGGRAV